MVTLAIEDAENKDSEFKFFVSKVKKSPSLGEK